MTDVELQIITPEVADEPLDDMLVALTEAIAKRDADAVVHGFLGGEFGYGAVYENETFAMHPFCWCEREDCPWCGGCDCPEGSFHYFVDGIETDYQGWMDFYMLGVYGETEAEIEARGGSWFDRKPKKGASEEYNRRRTTRHDAVCDYCLGRGIWAGHGAVAGVGAPHFWHKPTNLKVWWYKWIGRDMKAVNVPTDLSPILADCLKSLSI